MAYTNRQKAEFYLGKWNSVQFNPTLMNLYWRLYKAFDMADKAYVELEAFNSKHQHLKRRKS